MAAQTVESRVEILEARVTMLEELPARMDRLESHIVQLRTENAAEHSAMRQEVQAVGFDLRELRTAMEVLHERQGIQARALFEEALSRIAAMNEARPRSRKPKRPDDGGR